MNGTFICQLNYLFELVWEWVCFTGSTVAAFIKWSEATFYLLVCGLLLCFVSEFLTRLINHPSLNFQELEQCVFLVRTRFGTGFRKSSAIQSAPIFHVAILSFRCHLVCDWAHTVLQAKFQGCWVWHMTAPWACDPSLHLLTHRIDASAPLAGEVVSISSSSCLEAEHCGGI